MEVPPPPLNFSVLHWLFSTADDPRMESWGEPKENFHSFLGGLEFVKRIYILLDVKNLQMGGGLVLRSTGSYVLWFVVVPCEREWSRHIKTIAKMSEWDLSDPIPHCLSWLSANSSLSYLKLQIHFSFKFKQVWVVTFNGRSCDKCKIHSKTYHFELGCIILYIKNCGYKWSYKYLM